MDPRRSYADRYGPETAAPLLRMLRNANGGPVTERLLCASMDKAPETVRTGVVVLRRQGYVVRREKMLPGYRLVERDGEGPASPSAVSGLRDVREGVAHTPKNITERVRDAGEVVQEIGGSRV